MKRVLAFAALLMVSCGGNQSQTETTTVVEKSPKKLSVERSQQQKIEGPAILPKSAPVEINTITADKNIEYINIKKGNKPTEQ